MVWAAARSVHQKGDHEGEKSVHSQSSRWILSDWQELAVVQVEGLTVSPPVAHLVD